MNNAPKKRPWLQFHLSTAVVLTFVAGPVVWSNVRERVCFLYEPPGDCAKLYRCYGWPATLHCTYFFDTSEIIVPFTEEEARSIPVRQFPIAWWQGAGIDLACGLGILFAVGTACEWRIRRQERHP